jgi:hypothetical protein
VNNKGTTIALQDFFLDRIFGWKRISAEEEQGSLVWPGTRRGLFGFAYFSRLAQGRPRAAFSLAQAA